MSAPNDSIIHDGLLIEYTVVRSRRRRRTLSLTLDQRGQAIVAVPIRTSKAQIREFVARSAPWIIRKRETLAAAPAPPRLVSGASLLLLGQEILLEVAESTGARSRVTLEGESLRVAIPSSFPEEGHDQAVRLALSRWYRQQATQRLAEDIVRWSVIMEIEPKDVRVRDQRRRWGSCGHNGIIRFNFRLVMAPPEVIDYVVVHELAHLRVPNHSRAFWDEVARFIPDYAERRARLNQLSPRLAL